MRAAAIVLAAAAALWLTLANTIGGVIHPSQAGRVLGWSPFDARLKAGAALAIFSRVRDPGAIPPVVELAEAALRRDPTNIDAVRTLALARLLQNRPDQAQRLFRYSERLTRRDLGTRLWLIEERVQANDVEGALRHFDIALRTTSAAAPILMPVLVSAADEEHIVRQLRSMVEANPPWRHAFFEPLVHNARSTDTIVYLMRGLLRADDPADRFLAQAAFSRFLREGEIAQAWRLYDSMIGHAPAAGSDAVRNGGFQQAGDLPPIDWMLAGEATLAGIRQTRPGSSDDVALYVHSEEGRAGEIARQLLRLRPGRYRFQAEVGNVADGAQGQATVRLECAYGPVIFQRSFDAIESGGSFAVPAGGCANQWLIVGAGGSPAADQPVPWIDDVAIARIG